MSSHNPFEPHSRRPAAPALAPASVTPRMDDDHPEVVRGEVPLPSRGHLEDMRKADLQTLARTRGLDVVDGQTKAELVALLDASR